MAESTITSKGQTTLPKSIREALGVVPGDRVRYIILDNNDVRMPPHSAPVAALRSLQARGSTRIGPGYGACGRRWGKRQVIVLAMNVVSRRPQPDEIYTTCYFKMFFWNTLGIDIGEARRVSQALR